MCSGLVVLAMLLGSGGWIASLAPENHKFLSLSYTVGISAVNLTTSLALSKKKVKGKQSNTLR